MKSLHVTMGLVASLLVICGLWAGMGFALKLAFNLFMLGWNAI